MIRSGIILGLFLWALYPCVLAQEDISTTEIQPNSLNAADLKFAVDSGGLNVISAGRISKNLDELPHTVYIISHEEILRNQYTSLIDVLNGLPGIVTSQPGYGELGESFQIWGLTGNLYSKILINGMPIKPSVVSGMPIGSQLPIRQAEKIEVIYGSTSAIYGADAVSGVINIITRQADKGTLVRGDISLGEDGYNYMNFFIGGKGGKNNNILQYSFYGSKSEHNDMDVRYSNTGVYNPLNYYQQQGETFTVGGTEYEALDLTENLLILNGVQPDNFEKQYYGSHYEGSLTVPDMEALGSASHMLGIDVKFRGIGLSYNKMYRRTHSSLGLSPAFYKYNNPNNFWGENIHSFNLGYVKEFARFSSSTQLSSLVYRMDNNSSQGVTFHNLTDHVFRYSASDDFLFEQVFSGSPLRNLEIVGGLAYTRSGNLPVTNYMTIPFDKKDYNAFSETMNVQDSIFGRFGLNPISYSNLSEFLQFYYQHKRFRFLGGLRYDINTLYGNRFSPQLGILYKSGKKVAIHFNAGSAYKAPPSSITYQSLAYPAGGNLNYYQVVPNPKLKPEKFTNMELGVTRPVFKRARLKQTFFWYRITDHIIPETLLLSDFPYQNTANDSVKSWVNNPSAISNVVGSQTTLLFDDLVRSINLDAELSLSFLNRQDQLPDVVDIVRGYLSLTPKHTGKLKVSFYPLDNLYVNIESHWMTKWMRLLIPFESLYGELFKDTDGYYAMNAMTSYHLSDELSVFFKVTNLFDEKYGSVNATLLEQNLVYNPQLRRSIRFGLSYRLN